MSQTPANAPDTSAGSADTPEMRIANESEIAVLAPLAPSERYSFGNISEEIERQRVNKNRVRVLSGVAGGLVIGLGVTWGIIAASGREDAAALTQLMVTAFDPCVACKLEVA